MNVSEPNTSKPSAVPTRMLTRRARKEQCTPPSQINGKEVIEIAMNTQTFFVEKVKRACLVAGCSKQGWAARRDAATVDWETGPGDGRRYYHRAPRAPAAVRAAWARFGWRGRLPDGAGACSRHFVSADYEQVPSPRGRPAARFRPRLTAVPTLNGPMTFGRQRPEPNTSTRRQRGSEQPEDPGEPMDPAERARLVQQAIQEYELARQAPLRPPGGRRDPTPKVGRWYRVRPSAERQPDGQNLLPRGRGGRTHSGGQRDAARRTARGRGRGGGRQKGKDREGEAASDALLDSVVMSDGDDDLMSQEASPSADFLWAGFAENEEPSPPSVPVYEESPYLAVVGEKEHSSPTLIVRKDRPSSNGTVKEKALFLNVILKEDHLFPEVAVKEEHPSSELCVKEKHPSPEVAVKEFCSPAEVTVSEECQVAVKEECSSPAVTMEEEHPSPEVTMKEEHPSPEVTVKEECSSPEVTVKEECSSPEVTMKEEHPSPEVTVKEECPSPAEEEGPQWPGADGITVWPFVQVVQTEGADHSTGPLSPDRFSVSREVHVNGGGGGGSGGGGGGGGPARFAFMRESASGRTARVRLDHAGAGAGVRVVLRRSGETPPAGGGGPRPAPVRRSGVDGESGGNGESRPDCQTEKAETRRRRSAQETGGQSEVVSARREQMKRQREALPEGGGPRARAGAGHSDLSRLRAHAAAAAEERWLRAALGHARLRERAARRDVQRLSRRLDALCGRTQQTAQQTAQQAAQQGAQQGAHQTAQQAAQQTAQQAAQQSAQQGAHQTVQQSAEQAAQQTAQQTAQQAQADRERTARGPAGDEPLPRDWPPPPSGKRRTRSSQNSAPHARPS